MEQTKKTTATTGMNHWFSDLSILRSGSTEFSPRNSPNMDPSPAGSSMTKSTADPESGSDVLLPPNSLSKCPIPNSTMDELIKIGLRRRACLQRSDRWDWGPYATDSSVSVNSSSGSRISLAERSSKNLWLSWMVSGDQSEYSLEMRSVRSKLDFSRFFSPS